MHVFIVLICIDVGYTIIKSDGVSFTGIITPPFCVCPNFKMRCRGIFFKISDLRIEVIVRFVDIGGIV